MLPHEQKEVEDFVDYLLTRAIQKLNSNRSLSQSNPEINRGCETDLIPAFKEPEVLGKPFEVKIPKKNSEDEDPVLDWIPGKNGPDGI